MSKSTKPDETFADYNFHTQTLFIERSENETIEEREPETIVEVSAVRYDAGDAGDPYDLYIFAESTQHHTARLELAERRLVNCSEEHQLFDGHRIDEQPVREEFTEVASCEFDAYEMNKTELETEAINFLTQNT